MNPEQLKLRTSVWASEVGFLVRPLFRSHETAHRASQLKDAADSSASNYRAACIARSHKEFIAKISIALEECDEAVGWLEMSQREGILRGPDLAHALDEGHQLARILAKSRETDQNNENTSRKNKRRPKPEAPNDQ